MRLRLAILASISAMLAVAGCTSSATGGSSTAPPAPSSTTSSTTTPTSGSTSAAPAPSAFARLRGAFLLAGPTASKADAYEVTASGLTRRTTGKRISAVTVGAGRVIVDTDDNLAELHGPDMTPLGRGSAFSPALSANGMLATVALQGGKPTPGITKPRGFELRVASTLYSAPRSVFTTTLSLGNPVWTGPHTVLIAGSNGTSTTVLSVDTMTGTAHELAALSAADALSLTHSTNYLTAGQQGHFSVLPLTGGTAHSGPAGWTPLCWTGPSTLIASRGRLLATIAVTAAGAATPQPFAQVPTGLHVYSGDCSRVGT